MRLLACLGMLSLLTSCSKAPPRPIVTVSLVAHEPGNRRGTYLVENRSDKPVTLVMQQESGPGYFVEERALAAGTFEGVISDQHLGTRKETRLAGGQSIQVIHDYGPPPVGLRIGIPYETNVSRDWHVAWSSWLDDRSQPLADSRSKGQ